MRRRPSHHASAISRQFVGHGGPTLQLRRCFTLIEMLVSLAVISVAMAVVGIVFAITVKTAGQSAAYSETHNWVRQFMQQIEDDLRYCDPAQSILVLVGRTQAAALTQNDLDARKFYRVLLGNPQDPALSGYDPAYAPYVDTNGNYSNPRADLLMFFSNRPTVSQAPVPGLANDPYGGGVKFSPILVTYGHAALGQPVWNAGKSAYDFPTTVSHIEQTIDGGATPAVQSRIPANRWHLARRATILEPATGKVAFDASTYGDEWLRITSNRPDPTLPMPGDVARLDASTFLQGFTAIAAIAYTTYDFTNPNWAITPSNWAYSSLQLSIRSLLYSNGAELPNHHVATVLEDVPVDLESNMGVHMLPGCVWFQVEFLMPEDPRNSAQYSNADPTGTLFPGLPRSSRSDMPRWTSVEEGKTYVFVPDTPANRDAVARDLSGTSRLWSFARIDQDQSKHLQTSDAVPQRIIRMWPYAIRITVRVWDARGRLDEPIIRTIVHRFD